jgi:hypothetical protein
VSPEATASLPNKLQSLLESLPDRAFAARLEKVYLAAAHATARLTDMDLLLYDSNQSEEQSSADLSLWEAMAPVVGETVMDVNALLIVIRATFGAGGGNLGNLLDEAVGVGGMDPGQDPASRMQFVERVVGAARDSLEGQVAKLGTTIRSPQVVSDRWNLLTELQAFRSRFREQIGNLVFDTAAAFDYVQRHEVVPGHSDEVKSAITVRAMATDLARVLGARLSKISEAKTGDVQGIALQLEKEMDTFGRTAAYKALRAQDKRAVIEMRQRLRGLVQVPGLQKSDLQALVHEYLGLIQSLVANLNPALLRENDQQVWAAVGVGLEQAQSLLDTAPDQAAANLAAVIQVGQGLYGRDDKLDNFLRKTRKVALTELGGVELAATLDAYRELISNLAIYES